MIDMRIEKQIGVISDNMTTSKQVNLISWNGRVPVIDIRSWIGQEEKQRAGKGICLDYNEALRLRDILIEYLNDEFVDADTDEPEPEPLPEPQIEGQMQVSDYV